MSTPSPLAFSTAFLRTDLQLLEGQMRDELEKTRHRFSHGGNKGTSVEEVVRSFLRTYLSPRLAVGHGEIIDSYGSRSAQTDVVVTNDDHPIKPREDAPSIFFIEGVSAVGEVKSVLTTSNLTSSIANSRHFRRIRRTFTRNEQIFSSASNLKRFIVSPPYFLFAFESQLSLATIKDQLVDATNSADGSGTDLIDAILVVGKGTVVNFGDGEGVVQSTLQNGSIVRGWAMKPSETALFDFYGWLIAAMPRVLRFESVLLPYLGLVDR